MLSFLCHMVSDSALPLGGSPPLSAASSKRRQLFLAFGLVSVSWCGFLLFMMHDLRANGVAAAATATRASLSALWLLAVAARQSARTLGSQDAEIRSATHWPTRAALASRCLLRRPQRSRLLRVASVVWRGLCGEACVGRAAWGELSSSRRCARASVQAAERARGWSRGEP